VHFLVLLFLTLSAKAQTQQSDDPALAAARELAIAHSKSVSIVAERVFASFLPQPAEAAPFTHALVGRFQEIYAEVAMPIFARRLTVEEMRLLTEEFNRPVYQTYMAALGEAMKVWMPCVFLKPDALPKPPELRTAEHQRLARQLLLQLPDRYLAPSKSGAEPNQPQPHLPKKMQEDFDRFQEKWDKRMSCFQDGATAVLAEHLTIEDLKELISLEQSQPVQKLDTVLDEVHKQLLPKLTEEGQKMFGER
jgi:hypothetical protein